MRPESQRSRDLVPAALLSGAAVAIAWVAGSLIARDQHLATPFVGLGFAIFFGAAAYVRLGDS